MNIVHPTLQSRISFSPQFHHSVSKRFCCSLIIAFPLRRVREHRSVKIPSQALPIRICHRPHCPNDTPESAELHGSSKMEHLVHNAVVSQLCGVTSGQEGELSIRELRPYDVKQQKAVPSVKLERRLEWLPRLEYSMAHNMREPMIWKACQHGSRCSLYVEESCHLGIDGSYGFHLFQCLWHFFIWMSHEKYRRPASR